MLGPPPSQIFPYPVRMRRKKISPTMYGNMLLMSYSNDPHSMLKGKSRKCVKHQKMETIEQFSQWNESDITIGEPQTSYLENSWDKSNLESLKTNYIRNLHMLWKYLYHLFRKAKKSSTTGDPYSFMLPDNFCSLTWREFMSWGLEDSNQSTYLTPSNGHRGYTQKESRHKSNRNAY